MIQLNLGKHMLESNIGLEWVIDQAKGSEMKFFMSFGYDFFIGPADYSKEFGGMKIILNVAVFILNFYQIYVIVIICSLNSIVYIYVF